MTEWLLVPESEYEEQLNRASAKLQVHGGRNGFGEGVLDGN